MKRAITLSAMMIGLFCAIPAAAQTPEEIDARYSREFGRCIDMSQTTSDTVNCQLAEIDLHDTKLNNIYKITMSNLPNQYKIKLRTSQRKWIHYRDTTCKNESKSEEGGSFWTILYNGCITYETIKRLIWLEIYKTR
ncbi:lysozyme inhibitor LprI family protein [Sphingomonas colocasiae]|uniref:Lysozyme inhibitor LprI family protein n=1 Tax=Sphingomonas colocasiae TaxID=1848973 RepID=A0ABS7PNA2_9SPHN|nr:lysozyme inhibitor LprI family protein [Sphingomonas colocasiae]MBY8821927.1 lysozyme inhibitor LprI family protein [Sphingomonas colocasiae]